MSTAKKTPISNCSGLGGERKERVHTYIRSIQKIFSIWGKMDICEIMIKLQKFVMPLPRRRNPIRGVDSQRIAPLQPSDGSPNAVPQSSVCVVCGFRHPGGSHTW